MAEGMSKAHQMQQAKHKRSGKYVKQRERTTYNKMRNQLKNAARYNLALYRGFIEEQGGIKRVLLMGQNALNMEGYINSLKSRANT